MIFAIHIS